MEAHRSESIEGPLNYLVTGPVEVKGCRIMTSRTVVQSYETLSDVPAGAVVLTEAIFDECSMNDVRFWVPYRPPFSRLARLLFKLGLRKRPIYPERFMFYGNRVWDARRTRVTDNLIA